MTALRFVRLDYALFLVLAANPAAAQQVTHSVTFQTPVLTPANWISGVSLPAFDPDLGYLELVRVTFSTSMSGSLGVENQTNASTPSNSIVRAFAAAWNAGFLATATPEFTGLATAPVLAPFDGVVDHAGPSGTTASFIQAAGAGASATQDVTLPARVNAFRGPAGAPGTVAIELQAFEWVNTVPPAAIATQPVVSVDGRITLTYFYTTAPRSICTGDAIASWGTCPCGWGGGPSCGNSVNTLGASMGFVGNASIASDSLRFDTYGLPNSIAVFLQGDALTTDAVLGDGLRCVSGNLIRLGTSTIQGGIATYPSPGQLSVSVRGQVLQPSTRYYQTYYRNAADYCTPATANMSSGVALHWLP